MVAIKAKQVSSVGEYFFNQGRLKTAYAPQINAERKARLLPRIGAKPSLPNWGSFKTIKATPRIPNIMPLISALLIVSFLSNNKINMVRMGLLESINVALLYI